MPPCLLICPISPDRFFKTFSKLSQQSTHNSSVDVVYFIFIGIAYFKNVGNTTEQTKV